MDEHYRGPRTLVIGLDGATWRLLEPRLAAGDLPVLAGLIAAGARGPLRSTLRPESSVAWSSFATGVNAGRHGVFGFAGHVPGSYKVRLMTAADVRMPLFWEWTAGHGIRTGIFNVPLVTYPPRALPDGSFSVGGLITPGLRSDFTWPLALRDELLAHAPGYQLDTEMDQAGLSDEQIIAGLAELIRTHLDAALYLIRTRQPELFVAVFMATDRIQHHLWRHLDPRHPRYDAARSPGLALRILDLYRQLDAAVGALQAAAAADALVLVMSDHGFNGCDRAFSVNAWLAQSGWLALKRGAGARGTGARLLRRMRHVPGVRRLRALLPGVRDIKLTDAWRPDPTDWIDWSRTQAYFSDVGGIRINVAGREPEGIVPPADYERLRDEITAGLLALRDPATGSAPISAVYRREALYEGPHVALAPDLIAEPRRDDADPARNYLLAYGAPPGGGLFAELPGLDGNHDLDGILIAAGRGVTPGAIVGAHLWDLAPTLYRSLGIAGPSGLDGRILPELVSDAGALEGHTAGAAIPAAAPALTAEDEAALADHLRALGYLS